jgi:uncharacterized protein (DUF1800 family)
MSPTIFNCSFIGFRSAIRGFVVVLSLFISIGQAPVFCVQAKTPRAGEKPRHKTAALSGERRVAHVLNRLTFGARPGDMERVKAMGVEAFIAQQLDPDSLDDTALRAKLGKLPTLAMATPVIIEQYSPPKVAAVPSPSPLPTANPTSTTQNSTVPKSMDSSMKVPDLATSPVHTGNNVPGMQMEKQMEASGPTVGSIPTLPQTAENMKTSEGWQKPATAAQTPAASTNKPATPKPIPPAKNPQMVVTELQRAALLRGVYSQRQLYEVMVSFWENHFSIFAYKDADRYLLTGFDREAVRPFGLGRFRDLLGATAHSPAMLFYLDNWQSSQPRSYPAGNGKPARTTGGVNENYARELMELHTLGVNGGYTQKDVQEVARCFTGWTIQKPNEEGLFLFRPGMHDDGEKMVLGHRIPAGGGISDAERVLDILASHPSTARFIATKLARRFIADEPPASLIDRAADKFLKTDGSIRETLRVIISSPEFFSAAAYRAKVRTPFEFVVAALRALNASSEADPALLDWIKRMGQPVFGRLTPDGFPDSADQWLASGSLLERFNFASALATNRIKGTRIDTDGFLANVDLTDPHAVADRFTTALLAGDVTQETRVVIEKIAKEEFAKPFVGSPPLTGVGYRNEPSKSSVTAVTSPYVVELISMLVGAPEFQRR